MAAIVLEFSNWEAPTPPEQSKRSSFLKMSESLAAITRKCQIRKINRARERERGRKRETFGLRFEGFREGAVGFGEEKGFRIRV